MLVAKIIGGLGNQMFQYAATKALALLRDKSFALDTNGFSDYALHYGFELTRVFGLDPPKLSPDQLRHFFGWRVSPIAQRLATRWPFFPMLDKHIVVEPHLDYWPGISDVPDKAYLLGYWQSERYFRTYERAIRADFRFRLPLEGEALAWAHQIRSVHSVSLHIRRGDYVGNAVTHAYHGVCSLDYYRKAASEMAEQVTKPEFFVFSDDLKWARKNLCLEYKTHFVDCNFGADSYRDMQLMSLCQDHIIANSSFSWWGAWLNSRKNKRVFAPKRWFARRPTPNGLLPDNWTQIL